MNPVKYFSAVFLLFTIMNRPAAAAGSKCTYSNSVQQGGTTFDIISRPASGCAVQIVTISMRRGGKKIAGVKADVDYLARSAKAVDLTGDGKPELAVISRAAGANSTDLLDVYLQDGTDLIRVTVPEFYENSAYKGGDRFQFKDKMIVRSIPVYRDGDPVEKPTGGTRTLRYEFKNGALSLSDQGDKTAGEPVLQSAPEPAKKLPIEPKPEVPAVATLAITEIRAVESGIEIMANGALEKYKTVLLDKPERIAVDIPDAGTTLKGKKIAINRFGITTARVEHRKGFLRVVMETTDRTFDSYKVKSSGNSVFIKFIQ